MSKSNKINFVVSDQKKQAFFDAVKAQDLTASQYLRRQVDQLIQQSTQTTQQHATTTI